MIFLHGIHDFVCLVLLVQIAKFFLVIQYFRNSLVLIKLIMLATVLIKWIELIRGSESVSIGFFFQISSSPCSRTVGSFPKQRLFIETCYFDEYASYSKGKTENVCAFDNLDYRDRNQRNDLAVFSLYTQADRHNNTQLCVGVNGQVMFINKTQKQSLLSGVNARLCID